MAWSAAAEDVIRNVYRMDRVLFVNKDGSTFLVPSSVINGPRHAIPAPLPAFAYASEVGPVRPVRMPDPPRQFSARRLGSEYMVVTCFVEDE